LLQWGGWQSETITFAPFMLTEKEKAFLGYWEKNRSRQKKLVYQLAVGLPFGLVIGALILTNFFAGWYKRAEMIANSQFNPWVLYIAALLIAVFFAIFSKKFQWDQQEQRYKELKHKQQQFENETKTNNEVSDEHS
jgi:membrane protein implicated in regulation of membrane protease activity